MFLIKWSTTIIGKWMMVNTSILRLYELTIFIKLPTRNQLNHLHWLFKKNFITHVLFASGCYFHFLIMWKLLSTKCSIQSNKNFLKRKFEWLIRNLDLTREYNSLSKPLLRSCLRRYKSKVFHDWWYSR